MASQHILSTSEYPMKINICGMENKIQNKRTKVTGKNDKLIKRKNENSITYRIRKVTEYQVQALDRKQC